MKKKLQSVLVLMSMMGAVDAQELFRLSSDPSVPKTNTFVAWVNPGHAAEESVISNALVLRIPDLERLGGIRFDTNGGPRVDIEWSISDHEGERTIARYNADERTVMFPMSIISELTLRYGIPLSALDPRVLAKDEKFGETADHELGHALSDQVSRRVLHSPFFNRAMFDSVEKERQLGLNIIAEGIGTCYEELKHPKGGVLTYFHFPGPDTQPLPPNIYQSVVYDGGHWVVHDILKTYGERGMVWLIDHPFPVNYADLRSSAQLYRELALTDLAKGR